jgi:hypothetical protein
MGTLNSVNDFLLRQVVLAADEVVVAFPVGIEGGQMLIKAAHQFRGKLLDGTVGIDQLTVVVAQTGDHVREAPFEMEEHRAAAEEWLEVPVNPVRKELVVLRQQLCFATGPFQKRLRFDAGNIGSVGKLHRLLFVVGVERTVGVAAGRDRNVAPTRREKLGEFAS